MQDTASLVELIEEKLSAMEAGDVFSALEVSKSASESEVQASYFRLARKLHPDRLARSGLSDTQQAQARSVFEYLTKVFRLLTDPEKRRSLLRAAESGEAVSVLGTATERLRRDEARIFFHKGKKMVQKRDWDRAERFFGQAMERDPDNPELLTHLGWVRFNRPGQEAKAQLKEAMTCWSQALALAPKNGLTLYYVSLYHKTRGDLAEQRRHLESALMAEPGLVEAQRELRLMNMRAAKQQGEKKSGLLQSLFPSIRSKKRK